MEVLWWETSVSYIFFLFIILFMNIYKHKGRIKNYQFFATHCISSLRKVGSKGWKKIKLSTNLENFENLPNKNTYVNYIRIFLFHLLSSYLHWGNCWTYWSFLFIVFSALSTPTNQQTSLFSFLGETLIILTTTSSGLGRGSFEIIYVTNTHLSFCNSFESEKRIKYIFRILIYTYNRSPFRPFKL